MHTLVTARLRVEPLVVAHADALYPILADGDVPPGDVLYMR